MDDKEYQSMTDVIKAYINERRDNKEVALLKEKPKKNVGGINYKIEEAIKNADRDNNELKEIVKQKKTKEQTPLEFHREKNTALFALANNIGLNVESIKSEYENSVIRINSTHKIDRWLSDNCKNAAGISFATHVIKLTHSRIKGASNIFDTSKSIRDSFLTTSSFIDPIQDDAIDNAAFTPIATLLKLEHVDNNGNSKALSEYILEDDYSPFQYFSSDKDLIKEWVNELKKAFGTNRKSSHFLAKQIYFPVDGNEKYHLLMPIISSSLAHELHQRFEFFTTDDYKKVKDQQKKKKYSTEPIVIYPHRARIAVTASSKAHSNVSPLNQERRGKLYLLSAKAPVWQQYLEPPLKNESIFYAELRYRSRDSIKVLQKLLMAIKINERSKNDPKIHSKITLHVNEIIDVVFDYVQSMQALKDEVGWSEKSALKEAHQLWLDPYREDEEFQKKRNKKEWHHEIENDFSMWLNKQLEHKKMIPGNQMQRLWKDIFAPRFREFHALTEAEQ